VVDGARGERHRSCDADGRLSVGEADAKRHDAGDRAPSALSDSTDVRPREAAVDAISLVR
jgi:hypothetical protein